MSLRNTSSILLLIVAMSMAGCGGSSMTSFVHDQYNFGFVERVAIIPFANQSDDQGAGARSTNMVLTEILAARAFDVVEPGEVSRVLQKHNLIRTENLTTEQALAIGKELRVQGLLLGAVNESSSYRSGTSSVTKVSLSMRLVESEQGETIWSASGTAGGRGFWASLFGTGDKSKSEVTRQCVKKVLGTLFD